jgi:hypothetical protein
MKITKTQLKQIIKEELEDTLNRQVYIVAEPSTTYEGEFTEIRLLGVFLNKTAAMTALEKQGSGGGYGPDVFAVPVGKIDPTGYTG